MSQFISNLNKHKNIFVLTGAGISLLSGIPTYRDANGRWTGSQPIQHGDYIKEASVRQRYWARSMVGWRNFGQAKPNPAHQALAEAESRGRVTLLVTQNVDRLHQRAGSEQVVDLHGRLDQVICLECGALSQRAAMQQRLEKINPDFELQAAVLRPDGDADVPDALISSVNVPACALCSGVLKPDVVFFGDNVPRARVERCQNALGQADALLVIGSSLQVYSGYRFCHQAAEQNKSIFCINPGQTRADNLIRFKTPEATQDVLKAWIATLT